ncbi:MAG: hypothetical protein ACPGVO_05740 [Spirulinaceae cyanobacterium]
MTKKSDYWRLFMLLLVGICICIVSQPLITFAQQENETAIITVANRADFEALFPDPDFSDPNFSYADWSSKRQVRVIGEYRQIDLRMLHKFPPAYRGLAAIFVDDLGPVLLSAGGYEEVIRPPEEIAQYQGKRVAVTGILWETMPPYPTAPAANRPLIPCLLPVDSIELLDQEEVEIPTIASQSDYDILRDDPDFFKPGLLGSILYRSDRRSVRIIGEYRQIDIQEFEELPPEYDGRVVLFVEGLKPILLYPDWNEEVIEIPDENSDSVTVIYPSWNPDTTRPAEEIEQYDGKRVAVTGTLWNYRPEQNFRLFDAPEELCLFYITSIELFDDAEFESFNEAADARKKS